VAIDRWRAQKEGLPSRAEAIRRLVAQAIGEASE
jgi:metal-responsive CopG/Arc/MetJ family transcriptional regulator